MITRLRDYESDAASPKTAPSWPGGRDHVTPATGGLAQLRILERIDTLKNDIRADGIAWGRWIYFALLAGIALAFLNFLLGPALFLQAEGLVLKQQHVVAMLYTARIRQVQIIEGDEVQKGDPLMRVESSHIVGQIAELTANVARLTTKRGQIKVRASASKAVLPIAREHAAQNRLVMEGLDQLKKKSLVTGARLEEALGTRYESNARLARLEAEAAVLDKELSDVNLAHKEAAEALDDLKAIYNKGVVRSPVDGIVGPRVPSAGEVRIVGREMLRLYSGKPYILAFLPDRYLFGVNKGDRVKVSAGSVSVQGTVLEVLAVADALPPEFQNIFKPRERSRLVRISLQSDDAFAVSQKVTMTGMWW